MSSFASVYRIVHKHVINLICLPKGNRISMSAEHIATEVQNVQSEVNKRLEETNARHKATTDKHRHFKVFEEGDR